MGEEILEQPHKEQIEEYPHLPTLINRLNSINFDVDQDDKFEAFSDLYAKEFAKVGLSFDGYDFEAGRIDNFINLHVVDAKKFVEYLNYLSQRELLSEDIQALEYVVGKLVNNILDKYDLSDSEDDRMIELLGNISDIVLAFRRVLGDNYEVDELEKFVYFAKSACLVEYLASIKVLGYGSLGVGRNPSTWLNFLTARECIRKWKIAINNLKKVAKNPNASEIYEAFKEDLLDCIDYVEKDSDANIRHLNDEDRKIMTEGLAWVRQAILDHKP